MNATITYRLSSAGQKASILAGGNGKDEQTITVERDHPEFARVLARATVNADGSAVLDLTRRDLTRWDQTRRDSLQTVTTILDYLDAGRGQACRERGRESQGPEDTLAVLREERRARRHGEPIAWPGHRDTDR